MLLAKTSYSTTEQLLIPLSVENTLQGTPWPHVNTSMYEGPDEYQKSNISVSNLARRHRAGAGKVKNEVYGLFFQPS